MREHQGKSRRIFFSFWNFFLKLIYKLKLCGNFINRYVFFNDARINENAQRKKKWSE